MHNDVGVDVDLGAAFMRCRLHELTALSDSVCLWVGWCRTVWRFAMFLNVLRVTMAFLAATAQWLPTFSASDTGIEFMRCLLTSVWDRVKCRRSSCVAPHGTRTLSAV